MYKTNLQYKKAYQKHEDKRQIPQSFPVQFFLNQIHQSNFLEILLFRFVIH